MKNITMKQWENKYVKGEIKRFDQKNQMFLRPGWDPEINGMVEDWSLNGPPQDEAGFTLEDRALLSASSMGTMLALFNADMPNPMPGAMSVPNKGPFAFEIPEEMKLDSSDPQELTKKIKKVAKWFGADMVGICRLDRRWVYSHTYGETVYFGPGDGSKHTSGESIIQEIPDEFQYAIVMCYEMDYEVIQHYSTYASLAATSMGYSRMAITNHHLSSFIKDIGYKVINCTNNNVALSIPMAMQAGLGDLGRNGVLITPKYGPRVRISKVITDLPLVQDSPIDFGVTEFCEACEICSEKCPSQSLQYGERSDKPRSISNIDGVLKWHINAETCRVHWSRSRRDCAICINVCPYNKPDTWFHRSVRWCTDHMRWGDPLYVWGDKMLGYGKAKSPERFWTEWKP
jgi:reductive dehalogenase